MANEIILAGIKAATDLALEDLISESTTKAYALVHLTFGEADDFRSMNPAVQDDYMWTVADLIDQANEARHELGRRSVAAVEAAHAEASA